jgi:hypothetical protein
MMHVLKPILLVRFDVLMAVKMSMFIFWVATPCGLQG